MKISLADFFTEKNNTDEGAVDRKCATLKIENKTDRELIFDTRAYIDNEEVTVSTLSGNTVEAGRISRYITSYYYGVSPNTTEVESLDQLYGLEWSADIWLMSETSEYTDSYALQFSVEDALNGETVGADTSANEAYSDVIQMMVGGIWFFNGGSDAAVNKLEFTEDSAVITQIVYDGNGSHANGTSSFSYLMSDSSITLTLADGSELAIDYAVNDGVFVLEDSGYLTPAEVDAGLQGYWGVRKKDNISGLVTEGEYIYHYDNGNVTYEYASKALDGGPGDYYYFGPYEGTYTIDGNGLSATAKNNWQFGFNIIDGEVVMVRCGDVCSPVSGFKGQDGYSFD